MTDDEKREAERLASTYFSSETHPDEWFACVDMYAAGRASIQAEYQKSFDKGLRMQRLFEAERACSTRLREALRKAILWADSIQARIKDNRTEINFRYLSEARAEHEASRD